MTSRGDWVRVECIDELAPGTAVELRPCARCGKSERTLVTGHPRPSAAWGTAVVDVADGVCLRTEVPVIPLLRIIEGRVYRYQLPPEATDDAEAVTRERELAR